MGKLKNPQNLTRYFNVNPDLIDKAGVINVILNADTEVFIDPLLLPFSRHPEISNNASETYIKHFEKIILLLSNSKEKGDFCWRNAERLFSFSEISWTCLGYSSSVRGAGFGKALSKNALESAYEIVKLGIQDIDLFMALGLFEEGIGPDRISDMTTNIIWKDLVQYTMRVNNKLKIPTKEFTFKGERFVCPENPFSNDPLLLVPKDIVRDLPIATSYNDISRISRESEEYREQVNLQIGEIFASMSAKKKESIKNRVTKSKEACELLIEMLNRVSRVPYNFELDHNGELFWMDVYNWINDNYPMDLSGFQNKVLNSNEVVEILTKIIMQFRRLIEDKGQWKMLWQDEETPRREKAAQGLFFAVAESYCFANNLDLTPEADLGNGPVDFKISQGAVSKCVVEIKLSRNPNVLHGYEKQLETYKKADETNNGFYVLIDVGRLGNKYADLQELRNKFLSTNGHASEIFLIDANERASASKRK